MNDLKYINYDIVFQEVPNEISLVFNISGCPHKCEGCHSKHLWEYTGNYMKDDYIKIIDSYKNYITCVCFMGGDQNIAELYTMCRTIKDMIPNMKICIYSGLQSITSFSEIISDNLIDYLKIGPYVKSLGGLDSCETNQKMYKIYGNDMTDITYLFRKKG